MAILRFDAAKVRNMLEHSKGCTKWRAAFGQENPGPGLWLVGDQGVYLMSNGDPMQRRPQADPEDDVARAVVAYAQGLDPEVDDDWWVAKRQSFGGDDGVEFIPAESVEAGLDRTDGLFEIEISQTEMAVLVPMRNEP